MKINRKYKTIIALLIAFANYTTVLAAPPPVSSTIATPPLLVETGNFTTGIICSAYNNSNVTQSVTLELYAYKTIGPSEGILSTSPVRTATMNIPPRQIGQIIDMSTELTGPPRNSVMADTGSYGCTFTSPSATSLRGVMTLDNEVGQNEVIEAH